MGEEEDGDARARGAGDDADFRELAGAVGLARGGAGFVRVRLVIRGIVGREKIRGGDDRLLREDFVRFFFGDDVGFGAGDDAEFAGDSGDADFAGRENGDLARGGRVALRGDSNVGGNDFDGVAVVAAKGERAVGEFGDGAF